MIYPLTINGSATNSTGYTVALLTEQAPSIAHWNPKALNALLDKICHHYSFEGTLPSLSLKPMGPLERIGALFSLIIFGPLALIFDEAALYAEQALKGQNVVLTPNIIPEGTECFPDSIFYMT